MCSGTGPGETSIAKRPDQMAQDVIMHSADAKQRNSIYKLVLSTRRRLISNNNLKALVFLYHNQRLTSGAFIRDEDFEEDYQGSTW